MYRQLILVMFSLLLLHLPYGQDSRQAGQWRQTYLQANSLYNAEFPNKRTDSLALALYKELINQFNKYGGPDTVLFNSYLRSAILESAKGEDQQSLTGFLQAISIQKKSSLITDSLLFQPILFAGSAYYQLDDLDSAAYWYREAELLTEKYPGMPERERLYNKSGVLFYETGDYSKCIQYFKKALSLVESNPRANQDFIVNYKNNLASAYRKMGNYEQAMSLYKSLLPMNIRKNELLHNIAVTCMGTGDYIQAIGYLKLVSYKNQAKYNDLGRSWMMLQQSDSAAHYFELAETAWKLEGKRRKDVDYGMTLKNKGDLMMFRRFPDSAIVLYQKAIIQTDPDFNDPDPAHNPSSFQGLHHLFALFDALVAKARAFQGLDSLKANVENLKHAFDAYGAAIHLATLVQKSYYSDDAKLFLSNNLAKSNEDAVEVALQLYEATRNISYLEKAFNIAENSKASILLAGLNELSLSSIPGLPQELLAEEKKLKSRMAKLNLSVGLTDDSNSTAAIQKEILEMDIRLSSIQEKLESNPKYHQLKFTGRVISIDSLQKNNLPESDAMICYYFLQQRLVCFYLSKHEFGYRLIKWSPELQKNIISLTSSLHSGEGSDQRSMEAISSTLYNALIGPVYDQIKTQKHLVIIPQHELGYIPFEILTDSVHQSMLLNKFAISYQYSANFLNTPGTGEKSTAEVLAMAPFTEAVLGQASPVLTGSANEISGLDGRILKGSQATKAIFLQTAPSFPLIHLATHAMANDESPLQSYIEFYPMPHSADTAYRLYAAEIYQLNLASARLVILSACETGTGQLVQSEGIMSLSRAFSYAGCQSVITSLWKADDEATTYITRQLHQFLKKGYDKDEALQNAKLSYLQDPAIEARRKTPGYWAHLVLVGNPGSLVDKHYTFFWIAGFILLLVIGIWSIKKSRPLRK